MKILAFAGSNSSQSINKKLVTYVASQFDQHDVEVLDLNDYEVEIYGVDKEQSSGFPEKIKEFASKIEGSDLLIISLAEHNANFSTAFKNVYDWLSRFNKGKAWYDKNMFVLATSPGARGGQNVLDLAVKTFPFYGGNVVESFSLPQFHNNFDETQGITLEDKKEELFSKIKNLK